MDRVVRYESMAQDLNDLARDLGIPEPVDVRRSHVNAKGSYRQSRELVLTSEINDAIARDFWREIQCFGYEAPAAETI